MGINNSRIPMLKKSVFTSKDDLVEVAKAVHDELKSSLDMRFKGFEDRLSDAEANALVHLGKMIDREVGPVVERVLESKLGSIIDSYREKVSSLEKSYEAGLIQIRGLLQSMPVPQTNVTVPESAIQIKNLPSQVIVPPEAILVKVEQAPIQINIPPEAIKVDVRVEQEPSQVNIPAGAIKLESVKLEVPKEAFSISIEQGRQELVVPDGAFNIKAELKQKPVRSKTEKSIVYSDVTGRPEKIIEEITQE